MKLLNKDIYSNVHYLFRTKKSIRARIKMHFRINYVQYSKIRLRICWRHNSVHTNQHYLSQDGMDYRWLY